MLLPRYSLRWVLGGTAAAGLFFVLVNQANQGAAWAFGMAAAIAAGAVFLAVYAWLFFLIWLVSVAWRWLVRTRAPQGRSPFAAQNS